MALIDLSNYGTLLHASSIGRVGTPNGNVFFDTTGKIEFIQATEVASYTPAATTGSISQTITSGTSTILRNDGGNYLTDGFRAGMSIATTLFTTNAGNNDTWVIASISTNGDTITTTDNTGMVTETDTTTDTSGALTTNSLILADGLRFEAVYAFENQERSADEALRKFDRWTSGTFKFGGAYKFINARVPSIAGDRSILRGSGWDENDAAGVTLRKYFGNKGLSNIEAGSQPYYQQSIQGTATDFAKVGQIDEAILIYHDGNGDGTPNLVNLTTYEAVSIRTYGQNYDRKNTVDDLGIAELGGYSTGFALNESVHITTNTTNMPFANVLTTPAGVWIGMNLNHIAAPAAKTGVFSDDAGTNLFSWELLNTNGANLDECVAWLDAFATDAAKEADALAVNTGHLGKDIETWYSYNAAGQVVTKSGVTPASEGLFINSVPVADQQRVVFTADDATVKAYSFSVSVEAELGATAKADTNAWYHAFFAALYNASGAVTVLDNTAAAIKGLASTADANNKIIDAFDYTGDTVGGTADTDKDCVYLCEGDGGATQAKTLFTIKKLTTVAFTCIPAVENNV